MINLYSFFFFFNDTATTEIYTLSLHDALPIWLRRRHRRRPSAVLLSIRRAPRRIQVVWSHRDQRFCRSEEHTSELRHSQISYAVFCLKKKKKNQHVLLADNTRIEQRTIATLHA